MSMGQDAIYELERERKRELYLSRIRENTAFYLEKYQQIYNEYFNKGYTEVLKDEMVNLKEDLEIARNNLNTDPEYAKDISLDIKGYIYALRGFYNNARKEQEQIHKIRIEKEQLQKEAEKDNNLKQINKAIKEIKNPIQREIAYKLFMQLKNKVLNKDINLIEEIEKIKQISLEKSQEYQKEAKKEELKVEIEKIKKAPNPPEELLSKITQELDKNNFEQSEDLIKEADQKILDESIRKETVKSIYKTLKAKGFLVEKPKMINGEVVIKAQKPSGNRAYCKVQLDGKFSYKFDHYKGDSCKKDIELFEKELNNIYGVKIKNKKITWQNPDMIYKDGIKAISEDENYL